MTTYSLININAASKEFDVNNNLNSQNLPKLKDNILKVQITSTSSKDTMPTARQNDIKTVIVSKKSDINKAHKLNHKNMLRTTSESSVQVETLITFI